MIILLQSLFCFLILFVAIDFTFAWFASGHDER